MGLLRLLVVLTILWIVWRLLVRAFAAPPSTPSPQPRGDEPEYVPLTRCSICGAHIPQPRGGLAPICERCRTR